MPKPKRVPLKLPFLFRLSKLPDDVIKGMLARAIADPVEEAIENEEFEMREARAEEYLLHEAHEARTEDGRLDIDPETGQVRLEPAEPVTLWAHPVEDGLQGGLNDIHGGKIPIAKPRGRPSKKKRRKRRRSA